MELLALTKELCALPGISGDEGAVAEYITNCIKDYCDYKIDNLGNIIAHKKGKKRPSKTLMLNAHMDEVGFTVCHIGSDGLLRFHAVGGVDAAVTVGRRVRVGRNGVPGVVGTAPIHLVEASAREKDLKPDELYIDIGAESREEAVQLVSPGDSVTFEDDFVRLGEGLIMGKALDDRAGCAMLIHLIQSELEYDCVFTFTVQEEIGCVGAKAAAFGVRPEVSLVVETTTAGDLAGVAPNKKVCALGQGPVVPFMDRGTVYDRELYARARRLAAEKGIPCQTKEGVYGGTEGRSIQTAAAGARVLAVSLPCRYLHSASCVLAEQDMHAELELLKALIEELAR